MLSDGDDRRLLAYHWHPESKSEVTWPHLHIYGKTQPIDHRRMHLSTGRISLESVLRLAMDEFGVEPLRDRRNVWRRVLDETETAFRTFKTWS